MMSIFGFPDWLALGISLVVIFIAILKRRSHFWDRQRIPSFRPSLIQGNIQSPFVAKTSTSEQITAIYKQAKNKGYNYFGIYTFMCRPQFVPVNLNLLKNILVKDFQYFTDRGFFYNEKDDPLSAHLFALGGQKWRNLRVKMTPTFTAGKMKQMFQTVANCGTILTNIMSDKLNNNEPVDIKDILGCYSTDIICSCAFGLDSNTSNDPDSLFRRMGKKFFDDVSKWRLFLILFSINLPKIAKALHIRQTPKDVSDFFIKVVEDTINYRLNNNYTRNDFLQLMIEMQKNDPSLTLNIIAAQCFVFFIAGFETSSTTMTFALYELAKNQELQSKVREEIETVLKRHDGQVSYDSIMDLKYMGQVIEGCCLLYYINNTIYVYLLLLYFRNSKKISSTCACVSRMRKRLYFAR